VTEFPSIPLLRREAALVVNYYKIEYAQKMFPLIPLLRREAAKLAEVEALKEKAIVSINSTSQKRSGEEQLELTPKETFEFPLIPLLRREAASFISISFYSFPLVFPLSPLLRREAAAKNIALNF